MTEPLAFGPALDDATFRHIQRRMALDFCKWDIQVGDTSTLFPQPLVIRQDVWNELKCFAESLAIELQWAEIEILHRPELHAILGLPGTLQSLFKHVASRSFPEDNVRTLRFDFHYTSAGWRVSEVNSDVPGGYAESSCFTRMVSDCYPNKQVAGNPATTWARIMAEKVGKGGCVALLSAPGFLEDQQVTSFLSCELESFGVKTFLIHDPSQLSWEAEYAFICNKSRNLKVDAIVRFYQAEWLARLPQRSGWKLLVGGCGIQVTNPGFAILTESKRFPLVWRNLASNLNTWKSLMPECRDLGNDDYGNNCDWVLKGTFSNTGDDVYFPDCTSPDTWRSIQHSIVRHPRRWVLQRRFETLPIVSESGPLYPCIGVYTINGRAVGAYARVSKGPIINFAAMDAALLVDQAIRAE